MERFEHLIIGFGKGGKTLAAALAARGQRVALVERSDQMFGGTCINVACIPSKLLEHRARRSNDNGGDHTARALAYPVLRDAIYTHPTMSEAFNDLFAGV